MKHSLPILLALSVLLLGVMFIFKRNSPPASGTLSEQDSEPVRSQSLGAKQKAGGRSLLPPNRVSERAMDFPHRLETFDGWDALSAEEMRRYRVSLISRVGRWEAEGVEAFFFRVSPLISEGEALTEFRESVLGVWCAKDVRNCLDQLAEHGQPAVVAQDALAGWAREDWLTALRYLQAHGDKAVEARAGGDSSRFVFNLISEVARANGIVEATEVVGIFKSENNRDAAAAAIEKLQK